MKTIDQRFWEKVDTTAGEGCWQWLAYKSPSGYGTIRINKKNTMAHRQAYELLVNKIPSDMTVDHLCKNPSCVNPSHMEIVTLSENVIRAKPWEKACVASGVVQSSKMSCPKGHSYDNINTYVTPKGRRDCKECRRAACRRNYWKNKGEE